MSILFGTQAWADAMREQLNSSTAYSEAAADWQGDFYLIAEAWDGVPEALCMYLDLQKGRCLEATKITDQSTQTPEFQLSATLKTWRKIVDGKLDPVSGIMTRQLKLKGDMMKVIRMPKAAVEMVNCAIRIETEWPST